MELTHVLPAALLAGFFLLTLLRLFRAPLRLAARLLSNTFLGFVALFLMHLAAVPGIGLNLWNALVIGVLGLPGLGLLLLLRWVL